MISTAMAPRSAGTHAKNTVKPRSTEARMLATSMVVPPCWTYQSKLRTAPGAARIRAPGSAVALPDEAQPLQRQLRVDRRDRPRMRGDQVGQAARRDDGRRRSLELLADALHDRVDLAGEPVDEPRLQRRGGRLADHPLGCGERHLRQTCRAFEQRI